MSKKENNEKSIACICINIIIFVIEVTSGLRKSKVMPGNLDPLDTKLSNLVKHAKRDYEMMVKKHSNINAESK